MYLTCGHTTFRDTKLKQDKVLRFTEVYPMFGKLLQSLLIESTAIAPQALEG